MELAQTFDIDETTRYAIYYDEYADNPLESWDMWDDLGLIVAQQPFRSVYNRSQTYNADIGANELIQHWKDQGETAGLIVDRLNRHGYIATQVSFYGHVQGDWLDVIAYAKPSETVTEPNDLWKWLEPVQQYWQQEVYVVANQTLVVYTNEESGNTIERWETTDSLAECYLPSTVTIDDLNNLF